MRLLNLIICAAMISGVVLFSACCGERIVYKGIKPDLSYEETQLRRLATKLGASSTSVERMELSELVSEVRSRIENNERPVARTESLGRDDWERINFSLERWEETIRKIEKYEKFVKSLQGKRIIILPEEEEREVPRRSRSR